MFTLNWEFELNWTDVKFVLVPHKVNWEFARKSKPKVRNRNSKIELSKYSNVIVFFQQELLLLVEQRPLCNSTSLQNKQGSYLLLFIYLFFSKWYLYNP